AAAIRIIRGGAREARTASDRGRDGQPLSVAADAGRARVRGGVGRVRGVTVRRRARGAGLGAGERAAADRGPGSRADGDGTRSAADDAAPEGTMKVTGAFVC